MKVFIIFLITIICLTPASAQYLPQVGVPGNDAISGTSSVFTGWATGCVVARGYLNIDSTALGYVTSGVDSFGAGAPDRYVVSLGDSGVATLTFASPLYDGPGPDFAVFENGFPNPVNDSQAFLELAFVEVSSDGSRYVRFPCNSLTQINTQIPGAGVYMYANRVNNLGGKYIAGYGTPFDLQELADSPGLDITNITSVRLVDVIGTIGIHASHDITGSVINDPFPTQFATGGFDLDAVGAIHQTTNSGINIVGYGLSVKAYPNPTTDKLFISVTGGNPGMQVRLTAITGQVVKQNTLSQSTSSISVGELPAGMYYLEMSDANGNKWVEKISKR